MTIELPDTNGLSVGRAARAYIDAGIPIAPFDPSKGNGKACWNLLHYRDVTTDRALIDSWREQFGPFKRLALCTSPGAFGAVVLDVDKPNKFPRAWRPLLESAVRRYQTR